MKTVRLVCGVLLCAALIGCIVGGGMFYARKSTAYRRTKIEPTQTYRLSAFPEIADRAHLRLCAARGLAAAYPENTLEAIRAAGEAGYRFVQMDVARTKDDRLVLLYDDTLERMAGRREKLSALTFAQLQSIPLRNGANIENAEDPHVPALTKALGICREYGMRPVLSVRSAACARLLAELPELQDADAVFISAQKSVLSALRALTGQKYYRTDILTEDAVLYAAKAKCGLVFDAQEPGNTDARIRDARRAPLWAWNVNRRETIRRMASLGVYDIGTTCILPMRQTGS